MREGRSSHACQVGVIIHRPRANSGAAATVTAVAVPDLANRLGDEPHADLVAAIADTNGRDAAPGGGLEEQVDSGAAGADVHAARVVVDAALGPARALGRET